MFSQFLGSKKYADLMIYCSLLSSNIWSPPQSHCQCVGNTVLFCLHPKKYSVYCHRVLKKPQNIHI